MENARLQRLADHLRRYSCIRRVELLPFHKLGEYKWQALRCPYLLNDTPVPTETELSQAKAIFRSRGLL